MFVFLYMCICVFCTLQILLNLYINCQQPFTDFSPFRLLLKTNYDGFLEKMGTTIIIFFTYLSNLFYYLFIYLFIIIVNLFIYLFLIPHGENMQLVLSKNQRYFFFFFLFVNELKLGSVTEASALCLCCALVHPSLIVTASLSVSKYCLVCRVSKSVDIKFVIQAE